MEVVLQHQWDLGLIWLSYVSACMGAWVGFTLLKEGRVTADGTARANHFYLILASIGFGLCGVWTMHYTGMRATTFPDDIEVSYDLSLVVMSGVVAVVVVYLAFLYVSCNVVASSKGKDMHEIVWCVTTNRPTRKQLFHCAVGACMMALGVVSMHYTGMAAVIIDADAHWQAGFIVLSVVIALVASFAGLLLLLFVDGLNGRLLSCLVIGLAVCGMHYSGMYAIQYTHHHSDHHDHAAPSHGFVLTGKLTSSIACCTICLILITFHLTQLRTMTGSMIYKKRYGDIIVIGNIFALIYIICTVLNLFIYDYTNAASFDFIIQPLLEFILKFTLYGLLASILIRYILSWFRVNMEAIKQSLTWQKLLDSSLAEIGTKSFFFTRSNTVGNHKWLSIRVYAVAFAVFMFDYALFLGLHVTDMPMLRTTMHVSFPCIVVFFILLLVGYLYTHTPAFHDLLNIHDEMKFMCIILGVILVGAGIAYAASSSATSFDLSFTFISMIGSTVIAVIPIEIILQKRVTNQPRRVRGRSLEDHLKDKRLLDEFMTHLNKECSMECLLFLIEQTQFKRHFSTSLFRNYSVRSATTPSFLNAVNHNIMSHVTDISVSSHEHISVDELLPYDLPLSIIVYENGEELVMITPSDDGKVGKLAVQKEQCKQAAYRLYQKYMTSSSEFEVNISFAAKEKLKHLLHDREVWMGNTQVGASDMVKVFDESAEEIYHLLQDPFARFIATNV